MGAARKPDAPQRAARHQFTFNAYDERVLGIVLVLSPFAIVAVLARFA